MTTSTWTVLMKQSSDAEFRAWGKSISDALTAIGMVQTADSGQINWTTVTTPAGTSASQGYEIWRMNDTNQSACPIYLKIEYGSSSGSATAPGLWFTIGTGSNGSGTINGTIIHARTSATSSGPESVARAGFACAQDGFFWLGLGCTAGSTLACAFGFSRVCDASMTPDATGGLWWFMGGMASGSITQDCYHKPSSTIRATHKSFPMPNANLGTSAAYGTDVAVYEPVVWTDRPTRVAGLIGCMRGDFSAGTPATFTSFGASRVHMPLTGAVGPQNMDYLGSTGVFGLLGVYS